MKKLYFLFITITFSFNIYSQDGFQERAKKISSEMSMVLSLDSETSKKVYHIQLKRFIEAQRIRNEHQNNKRLMNVELKKLQNRLWGSLNGVLGQEKMKSWNTYKKNKL